MALSNIFREPRRELIEQGFGFLALLIPIGLDVSAGVAFANAVAGPRDPYAFIVAVGMMLGLSAGTLFLLGGAVLLVVMHAAGEEVCGFMAERGFDPRPKNRPQ